MRLCCRLLLLALLLVVAMAAADAAEVVAPRIAMGRASVCCTESTARLTTNRMLTAEFMAAVLLLPLFCVKLAGSSSSLLWLLVLCRGGRNC